MRKRINLSFNNEQFELIKNKSIKENIKPSTLVKKLILDLIQKENKSKYTKEELDRIDKYQDYNYYNF